jgi:DNA mismatch repair protein MutL
VAAPPNLFSTEVEKDSLAQSALPSSVSPPPVEDTPMPMSALPVLRVLGQLASCYILAEGPEGLYLVDQHAAHERIIFEKIMAQRSEQSVDIQGLLDPLTIDLNPQQEQVLSEKKELISQFGFDLEPFGGRSYLLRAVPAVARDANLTDALLALLDSISNVTEPVQQDETIAITLACHGAITAGKNLTNEEMRELIRQLEQTENPKSCPHGRPTMVHLSARQLEKEFGRTG